MIRKRRLNPHRFDVSPRGVPEWMKRGWRGRSDLEPGQTLTRAEAHIEKLEGRLHAAQEKLGAVHTRAIRAESRVTDLEAALIERTIPARTDGFKLLAIVEIESDGEGRWEYLDGAPFDERLAFGWMSHPKTRSGKVFHDQREKGEPRG